MLRILLGLWLALLCVPASARLADPQQAWNSPAARDLAQIRRSGELRVLVNESRASSGEVRGQAVGGEYHRLKAFERYLNQRQQGSLRLKLLPRPKTELLKALQRGEGDLVASSELLQREKAVHVSSSQALREAVPLVVVTRQGVRRNLRFEHMAGRSLALPRGSAAVEAVRRINQQLAERKLAPLMIEWVDDSLAVEDVLEMVQAGIYNYSAVEQPLAERWSKVLPRLRIDRHLVLDNRRDLNWYVRPDAPTLRASLDAFLEGYRAPADQDSAFQRVYRRSYKVHYPLNRADRQRLEKIRPVLQKYAAQQDFDWLALAAIAFKESSLNPAARGANGATGLMQITPAAARSVGVGNIAALDSNVQAATRYMAKIRRSFFASPRLDPDERLAFILAAYNMGPQRVQSLRAEARRRGLDADRWFFQVERIALEQVGIGPVSYVAAVNKYRLAFDRERDVLEARVARK